MIRMIVASIRRAWQVLTLPVEETVPGDTLHFGASGTDENGAFYFTWAWGVHADGRRYIPK